MSKETGGPAFPLPATEWHGSDTGMDLRDFFAAKAMTVWAGSYDRETAAKWAYEMADAMIAARSR